MSLLLLFGGGGSPPAPIGDYLQARSAIAISGVTYAGWTPPSWTIRIDGTLRTTLIERNDFVITYRLDNTPSTCVFTTKPGYEPTLGHDVKVTYATPDEYEFAGTILQREALPYRTESGAVRWRCMAVGYQWLMDRYDRPRRRYTNRGVGTIVGDVLYNNTDGGFRVGYIPSSLGNIDIQFTGEDTVSQALQRIATACDAFWEVTADRVVNMYQTYPEGSLATLTNSLAVMPTSSYVEDLTQVRTRSVFRGYGSNALGVAADGDTTISVEETSFYDPSGGTVISGANQVTYTGLSVDSGPGALTGCSGILYEIAVGDPVDILIEVTDSAAETALAAILGGGLSGQASHYATDGRLSQTEATGRATADLSVFSSSLKDFTFRYVTPPRHLHIGRSLTVNITQPYGISGTFLIREIRTGPRGIVSGETVDVWRQVTASRYVRSMVDLLQLVS
jgi:hypothetical protein